MYYIAYNRYNNLTLVSETPIGIRENETIEECEGTLPDSRYKWNNQLLKFERIPNRLLSKIEYMKLFHDSELATIYAIAKQDIRMEIWLEKFKAVSEVDLTDTLTIAGVYSLEANKIISAGRAEEILKG